MANGELDVYAVVEVLGFPGMILSLTSLTLAMNLIVLSYACQIAPVLKALSLVVVLMAVMNIATTATWALGPKELTIKGIAGTAILTLMSLQALYLYRTKVTRDLTNLQTLDLFKTQVAGDFDGLRPERPARRACRTPESRCAQPAGLPAGSPAPLLGFSSCLSLAQVPGRLRAKRAR